tara:strand:- start:2188 stop:3252 length:1065 start_codon:yes stop_codon:yes gene_type:complete
VLRVAARGGALSTSFGKTNIAPCTFRWQRGEQIGQGSFGAVYQGLNQDTGALLAIKELQFAESDEMQELESMKEEIDMMRSLDHPHIVRYLGADVRGSTLYIMAEWMAGGSLRSIIDKFGPLQESVIRRYTRQVLDGLAYLHSKRIIHRDIKGANLLVDERGLVKLADFGAAKRLESTNIRQWQEAMRRARDRGSSGPAWSSSPTWAGGEERASIAAASASPVTELEDGEVMLHGACVLRAVCVMRGEIEASHRALSPCSSLSHTHTHTRTHTLTRLSLSLSLSLPPLPPSPLMLVVTNRHAVLHGTRGDQKHESRSTLRHLERWVHRTTACDGAAAVARAGVHHGGGGALQDR